MEIDRLPFGSLPDGREVPLFRLRHANDVAMEVLGYGGIVRAVRVPDRMGAFADVVLGYDDLGGYLDDPWFVGGLIGRFAGRIRGSRFALDGRSHTVDANDGPHHLHGGSRGFHRRLWSVEPFASSTGVGVTLHLEDDEAGGYSGRLDVRVSYTLTADAEWIVDYEATTDQPTVLNLTQHSYFNLAGPIGRDVLDHRLTVHADAFARADAALVPTGVLAAVERTPLDFRSAAAIGARIDDPSLHDAGGYDHDFVLRSGSPELTHAARVVEPRSGRTLDVRTTEPALHLYSGNFMDGSRFGKGGRRLGRCHGFCLETQHLPDSPNRPEFPSTVLRPGPPFRSRTVFAFGTDRV